MEILFTSDKLRDLFNSQREMVRKFGNAGARRLQRRRDELDGAADLASMRTLPGRCHELHGDREGQLALDVEGGKRLIFEVAHEPPPEKPDGGLDWSMVTVVRILGVEDYH